MLSITRQLLPATYSQSQRLQVELDLVVVLLVVSEEAHSGRCPCVSMVMVIRAVLISSRVLRVHERGASHIWSTISGVPAKGEGSPWSRLVGALS